MKLRIVPRENIVSVFVMLVLLFGFQGMNHVAEALTVPKDPSFSDLVNADDDLYNKLLDSATRLCQGLEFPRDTFAINETKTVLVAHRRDGSGLVLIGRIQIELRNNSSYQSGWLIFGQRGDLRVVTYYAPDGESIDCALLAENLFASVVSPLTEATLDGTTVRLDLTDFVYERDISKIREAVTVSGLNGVTVDPATVQRLSDTEITAALDFDGTDFTNDTELIFSVGAGAIADYTEDDFTTAVPVAAFKAPDLVIEAVRTESVTVAPGEEFRLYATLKNQGLGASTATTLRYYRSTDAVISTADTQLRSASRDPLAANATFRRYLTITAPTTPGTYYYGACVDSVTDESDTGNNCSAAVTVTVVRSAPDLVIEAVRTESATVAPGEEFRFYATLKNQGTGASTATTLRYYRSTDAVISTADTQLLSANRDPLAANATLRRYANVTAPTTPGTYYYGACVDSVTDESDTGNNCSAAVTVTVVRSAPDLVVEGVEAVPSTVEPGETFRLYAILKNRGTGASTATRLRYYRSTDAVISTADTQLLNANRNPLAANATLRRYANVTAPTTPGTYYYGACVDNITDESDTDNNCSTVVSVTVTAPPVVSEDVNEDGIVDLQDLVSIAERYGQTGTTTADVNDDGVVNVDDMILVAAALDADAAAAPSLRPQSLEMLTAAEVKLWLSQARQRDFTDPSVRKGILFLEQLLASLIPKETALLANYPNPFNPETWIPYQLAKDADVTLRIYAVDGQMVRRLVLGHQAAGVYQNRSRAAYWDGRNAFGEPVASGLYFYTLTAGDFTATRKMLIRK